MAKRNIKYFAFSVLLITVMLFCLCAQKPEDNPPASDILSYETADEHKNESNKEYKVSEISTKSGNNTLYGKAYIPNGEGKKPVIIISHGYMLTHQNTESYAKAFAKAGIAAYIFDFAGGAPVNKSEGSFFDMTPLTEINDLNAVLNNVKELSFTNTDEIYLMGHSLGGLVSAKIAAEHPDEITMLFLLAPAFVLSEVKHPNTDIFSDKFLEAAETLNYFDDFAGYKGQVYIFHGTNDSLVKTVYSEHAAKNYTNAKLITLKGEGHIFSVTAEKSVINAVIKAITKN